MTKQGKVWGETSRIFHANNVEVHRINAKKGFKCSQHSHLHKWNKFFIESGKLAVDVWKSYGLVDRTIIGPGEHCDVEPGVKHQFLVLEDTIAFEIYWVELSLDDISRIDSGGPMTSDDYRVSQAKHKTRK